jgi:hypothetical protein
MSTVLFILTFVVLTYLLQHLLILSPFQLISHSADSLENILGGLLQAHVTVASVALPLLIFVIERARDEEETRLPTSEVVMRESWVAPTTIFALLASAKMGWDYVALIPTSASVIVNALLFSLTVLLTARAILLTLSLSFSRVTLKEKGLNLIRRKAGASALESILVRLSENFLIGKAREFRVAFWLFGIDREAKNRFYVLNAITRGTLTDVNMVALKDFVDILPFKPLAKDAGAVADEQAEAGGEEDSERPAKETAERVFLVKRIGEQITEKSLPLILVERNSVESFDPLDYSDWIPRIFHVRQAHR